MLIFHKKKAMYDFCSKHNAFLCWFLKEYTELPEKLYYVVIRNMVESLEQDIQKLVRYKEQEQRKWIIKQVEVFGIQNKK